MKQHEQVDVDRLKAAVAAKLEAERFRLQPGIKGRMTIEVYRSGDGYEVHTGQPSDCQICGWLYR